MATILPALGASGIWKLKAPFDTSLLLNVSYTCQSIRFLSEAVASGIDVFEEIYVPKSIDRTVYDTHVTEGISLIVLVSDVGDTYIIPSPYIDGWPSSDVVPYVVMGAVIVLGAIPNTLDPSFLTPILQNTVKSYLGFNSEVEYVTMSDVTSIRFSEHEALEAARKLNITDDNSDYARRLKAESDLMTARETIQKLQQFIIDSGIPIPVVPG